ncbi:hypothetical protein PZB75_15605 [Streptomyces sp. AM 4-1-1]|uniref:hypothetical protein n=1 Tax=Streptomyces sp. AM 4-1-1 TaxID=3028710 RepID=UPI0023B9B994|nr:hypothetical protein [Streptomyces sp. AM 4-1-1]WEH34649.1 hypothetical protein PZB75_15605 [Streptomyces sp. AM 4-1-1]
MRKASPYASLCLDAESTMVQASLALMRTGPAGESTQDSLRRGFTPYDHTVSITAQLERLVIALEELPNEEKAPVVSRVMRVIEVAHEAMHRSGHLHFNGD